MAMVVMAIPGTRVSNRAVATSQVRQHISKDSSFLPCLIWFRRCFLKWTFIAGLMANLVDQTRILLNSADPCDQAPPERERSRCARSVPLKPPTEKSDHRIHSKGRPLRELHLAACLSTPQFHATALTSPALVWNL